MQISTMSSKVFREKKEFGRNHPLYDDKTIENMKQYFKIEHEHDVLLKYIRQNRIIHDGL
jgi:hypothetical protein